MILSSFKQRTIQKSEYFLIDNCVFFAILKTMNLVLYNLAFVYEAVDAFKTSKCTGWYKETFLPNIFFFFCNNSSIIIVIIYNSILIFYFLVKINYQVDKTLKSDFYQLCQKPNHLLQRVAMGRRSFSRPQEFTCIVL